VSNIGLATPQFFLGIIIILLFALKLKWIPVQGYTSLFTDFGMAVKQLIGPVMVLAIGQAASFARQTRSAMLEVMGQDYMRTARSKGVKENAVIIKHGLRNAMIPLVTVMGMAFGRIVGGAVIIENLFSVPGIGQLLTTAINNSDYFVVENIVFIISLFVIVCNLIVDILYGVLDPRIRVE
jgi:peptide/nickel transport system permease protein